MRRVYIEFQMWPSYLARSVCWFDYNQPNRLNSIFPSQYSVMVFFILWGDDQWTPGGRIIRSNIV